MAKPEITEKAMSEFLKGLGIKAEGIQAILKTYLLGIQRRRFKERVEYRMEREKQLPKEAVWETWKGLHRPQVVRLLPVGAEPTEKDFLLL